MITCAPTCRARAWQPVEVDAVIGPGMMPKPRPSACACVPIASAPDRMPASAITVALVAAARSRDLLMKRQRVGAVPRAISDTTAHPFAAEAWSNREA